MAGRPRARGRARSRPLPAPVLSTLAERIGARLGTATVFGAPVERDGVTVIPVAVAPFGIGAGIASALLVGKESSRWFSRIAISPRTP
jgi:hypothetical protein